MDSNRVYGNIVQTVREFDRGMLNSYENLMSEFRSQIRKMAYRVADSSTTRMNEDVISDFFDTEFSRQFDKQVDNYISGINNEIDKEIHDYNRVFNAAFASDNITNVDLNNVNNKFRQLSALIDDKGRKSPKFDSLFDEVEYEFRRKYRMDEDMIYVFRRQFNSFKEEVEANIRSEVNRHLKKVYGQLNSINRDAIATLQDKQNEQLKGVAEGLDVDVTVERINGLIELATNVLNTITEYNNEIAHSTHSFYIRNTNNILGSLENILDNVNNLSTEEEKKAYLASSVAVLPQVETTLNTFLTKSTEQYNKDVEKKQREEVARAEREAEERRRALEEERLKIERIEADILRQQQEEEERLRQEAAAEAPVVEEPVVEEPIVEEPQEVVVVEEPVVEEPQEVIVVEEPVVEEPQEVIVVEEPVVEEPQEVIVVENPVAGQDEIIEDIVDEVEDLQLPAVVEPVVTNEVAVVEPQVVEQTGLAPASQGFDFTQVTGNPGGGQGGNTGGSQSSSDSVIDGNATTVYEDELEEAVVIGQEAVEQQEERKVDLNLSDKAIHMRHVIASRKAKLGRRASIATIAACGLGIAAGVGAIGLTAPVIAAAIAVISAGGSVSTSLKEHLGRFMTKVSLNRIAKYNNAKLFDIDGKLVYLDKDGRELDPQTLADIQEDLDKKFFNKDRGLTNPTTIRQLNYKGFAKVKVDNLNAAFEEFGGYIPKPVKEDTVDDEIENTTVLPEAEPQSIVRDTVPAQTGVITRIINNNGQAEVVDAEVVEEEIVQEEPVQSTEVSVIEPEAEYQTDPRLVQVKEALDNNVDVSVGSMYQSSVQTIGQSCVDMFQGISDIFYNNKIENNEQLTALPMHKFNESMKIQTEQLMTSISSRFDNINKAAVLATEQLMALENENKQELISRLQNEYIKYANVAGFFKDYSEVFDTLLTDVCTQYNIDKDSKVYNELREMMKSHEVNVEKQLYDQLVQFSNTNAMAVATVFNTFGYEVSESMERGL